MTYDLNTLKPFGALLTSQSSNFPVNELPIPMIRELARLHCLVVLRGFTGFSTSDAFADYCSRWGEISVWPFGKVLELVEQENPADHIFDHNYVPMHWDGMYRLQVPEFQIFQCVAAPTGDQGGETTFAHTGIALERAAPSTRALWGKATGVYHRKMEYYNSKTVAPIVTAHPLKNAPVIRYNEPPRADDANFVNHPDLQFIGIGEDEVDDLHGSLREALYAPDCFYAHLWQTGDIVISDNYTLLHGRNAFTSGAPRHLRRVHVLGQPPLDNPHLVNHT